MWSVVHRGGLVRENKKGCRFRGSLEIFLNENLLLQVGHFTGKCCVTHFNLVKINT